MTESSNPGDIDRQPTIAQTGLIGTISVSKNSSSQVLADIKRLNLPVNHVKIYDSNICSAPAPGTSVPQYVWRAYAYMSIESHIGGSYKPAVIGPLGNAGSGLESKRAAIESDGAGSKHKRKRADSQPTGDQPIKRRRGDNQPPEDQQVNRKRGDSRFQQIQCKRGDSSDVRRNRSLASGVRRSNRLAINKLNGATQNKG